MKRFGLVLLGCFAYAVMGCGSNNDKPETPVTSEIAEGKALVELIDCGHCHNSTDIHATLGGRTQPLPNTMVYPPNLTPDKDTGIGDWTDAQILRAVRTGVDDQGMTLCQDMPRFAALTDEMGAELIAYLRSLPPVHHEIPDSTCSPNGGP
jgi:hypothetical protein